MIREFFENREIFLTGGSGIVGKALLEKVLRSCNIGKIYLLLRSKKNFTIEERLQKIKQDMIFRRLMSEKPNEFDKKVIAIPGDVELPMLGIQPECAKLMENVSIIIHSAATIRFDEPLKKAIHLNVGGTQETLKFAETLKDLEIFMHVSTFYSNPYLEYVEPKMYKAPMDWRFCLDLCSRDDIPDEMVDVLTRKLIIGFPNTYCFTKNLTESMVNEYRHKLPVAIYRPSVILFAIDEPEPGYPPTLTGAMGLFAVATAGLLKTLPMPRKQFLDISPQDFTIKALLYYTVKSTKIYEKDRPTAEVPIFHMSTYSHTDFGTVDVLNMVRDHDLWVEAAFEKNFLAPGLVTTSSEFYFMCVLILKQLLPALLMDLLLVACGRQPAMMKIQRKIFTTIEAVKPFMYNLYKSDGISYANEMLKELNSTEFHMSSLRLAKSYYANVGFTRDMIYSCREVLFKEDPSTIPRSRRIVKAKILLYKAIQLFLVYKIYQRWIHPITSNWEWSWGQNVIPNAIHNNTYQEFVRCE